MDGFVVIEFKITCVEEHVALRACALRAGAGRSRRGVWRGILVCVCFLG